MTNISSQNKNNEADQLLVYPNPTNGIITLGLKDSGKEQIEILDGQMKKLRQELIDFSDESVNVDISGLDNGLYFLRIRNMVRKIVVAH